MDPQRRRSLLIWTGSILLAAMFLLSGSGKLANGQASNGGDWASQFVAWGYPAWFRLVIGATEVLASIALLVPPARFYGAAALALTMGGAVVTHVANAETPFAAIPLVLGLAASLVAWASKPAWMAARFARNAEAA